MSLCRKRGTTVDQYVIVLPEAAAWPHKEVSKVSLVNYRQPAERGEDVLPLFTYLGLTYKMEYVSNIAEWASRASQLDPRITEHKED